MDKKQRKCLKIGIYALVGIGLLVFLYVVISGDGFPFRTTAKNEVRVVIFHVNDVHGEIGNFAKIAGVIEREKETCPNVFFVSAGDNFSGNPYVDQYVPRGEPILKLLNEMGCNLQVLGNHEFDYGQKTLADYMSRAKYQVICANILIKNRVVPQPEPFAVLQTTEGLKLAFLGILQISGATGIPDSNPEHFKNIVFRDEIETALKYRYLKQDHNVLVALTHLGYYKDEKLARAMDELDLIIGGHSHTVIEKPRQINRALIVQAGSRSKYLGRVELLFVNGNLENRKADLIDLSLIRFESPRIKQMIDTFMKNPELNRVIATLPGSVQGKQEMGNLITDAIRDLLNLDVAFYNSGGIRKDRLFETVRLKDVYAIEPFDNEVVIFEMTPEEIRSLIRYDYEHIEPLDLQVSGLEYTVVVGRKEKLLNVVLKMADGHDPVEGRTYRVGINNYMASAYRFAHVDPGRSAYRKVVELLISYLEKGVDLTRIQKQKRTHRKIIE
jgi:2',3'-cyclic-nucleotide 2'-phosphodiesterase (5'-nucleotidase family)